MYVGNKGMEGGFGEGMCVLGGWGEGGGGWWC